MSLRLLPYTPERDAYRLLGVAPSASIDEIGAACRRLARAFHPDHNGSARATQEMQVVNAVRSVMTDPHWRATYDRERHRFHSRLGRPVGAVSVPRIRPAAPLRLEARPAAPLMRYARALGIGVRAAVEGLAPPRCARCRAVTDRSDAYCAACGIALPGIGRI